MTLSNPAVEAHRCGLATCYRNCKSFRRIYDRRLINVVYEPIPIRARGYRHLLVHSHTVSARRQTRSGIDEITVSRVNRQGNGWWAEIRTIEFAVERVTTIRVICAKYDAFEIPAPADKIVLQHRRRDAVTGSEFGSERRAGSHCL